MPHHQFYKDGSGDALVDPQNYPEGIKQFLEGEIILLDKSYQELDTLVEVGCMTGRWTKWAMDKGLNYIGLDIVARYIQTAKQTAKELGYASGQCAFLIAPAEKVDSVLETTGLELREPLLFYPFNSFGNMKDPTTVLSAIHRSGMRACISTYGTDNRSCKVRYEYYKQCGYKDITTICNSRGACFASPDGLQSWCYHQGFLQDLCDQLGLSIQTNETSDIGLAHTIQKLQ